MLKSPSGLRRDEKIGEGLNRGRWVVERKIGEGGFAEVFEVHDTLQKTKVKNQLAGPLLSTHTYAIQVAIVSRALAINLFHLLVQQALKIEKIDKRGGKIGLLKAEHRVRCPLFCCQGSVAGSRQLRSCKPPAQTLKRLQDSPHVCRLVDGGFGTHEGRSYFVMELLGLNLAQLQRSVPDSRWGLRSVCTIGGQVRRRTADITDAQVSQNLGPALTESWERVLGAVQLPRLMSSSVKLQQKHSEFALQF